MKGFSLVELLVVISIIAIISAFTLPNFMGARDKAKDSARIADMASIKSALRLYYNDYQSYPASIGTSMTAYMPSILNLGYTYNYYQSNNGDSFCLSLALESGQGDDDIISQKKCGVKVGSTVCGIGNTTDKLFVVCAN
jgi:general secretion pathway protein G